MSEVESPAVPRTQTLTLRSASPADGVTIRNDTPYDALILLNNGFWGQVSAGYARAGNSVTLPSIVNVDAYALLMNGSGIWITWPGPTIYYNKYKINLTPGQSYSLSDFDNALPS